MNLHLGPAHTISRLCTLGVRCPCTAVHTVDTPRPLPEDVSLVVLTRQPPSQFKGVLASIYTGYPFSETVGELLEK